MTVLYHAHLIGVLQARNASHTPHVLALNPIATIVDRAMMMHPNVPIPVRVDPLLNVQLVKLATHTLPALLLTPRPTPSQLNHLMNLTSVV